MGNEKMLLDEERVEYDITGREDDMRSKGKSGDIFTQKCFEHKWVKEMWGKAKITQKCFELKWVKDGAGQG